MNKKYFAAFASALSLALSFISCSQWKNKSSIEQSFSSPQDFADQEIYHLLASQLTDLQTSPDHEVQRSLPLQLLEARYRLNILKESRATWMNYDARFLEYLESTFIPQLESLVTERELTVTGLELDEARQLANTEIEQHSQKLRAALLSRQGQDAYLFNRLFELIAFSRSETLGDGRIGNWNPADVNTIQGSASDGLTWVLDQIHHRKADDELDYDELMTWHRSLLGQAEHHFSHGGVVNDIYFLNDKGEREHASKRVHRWIADVNLSKGNLLDSLRLYADFLHMHPFGDSNGRIAEVGKVLISSKSGLLPLITREKTSVENYLFQRLYGIGLYEREAAKQAQETLDVFDAILRVTGSSPILGVDIEGSNIIFSFSRNNTLQVGIINRSYLFNPQIVGMPPVRGSPVLLDSADAAASFRMRFTRNSFKTTDDVLPTVIVQTERMGRLKTVYPIFVISSDSQDPAARIQFQFIYNHPDAGEVVWHNNGLNYSIGNPTKLAFQNEPLEKMNPQNQ